MVFSTRLERVICRRNQPTRQPVASPIAIPAAARQEEFHSSARDGELTRCDGGEALSDRPS